MSPLEKIHHSLLNSKKTLAFAESCTGGQLSAYITALPDASTYFLGSLVTYSNALKQALLGVSLETLHTHTAVSLETVIEMWQGVMRVSQADFGIAVTGMAGPKATKETPVGVVWIAFGAKDALHTKKCHFSGDRKQIIKASCEEAFFQLANLVS